MKNLKAIQEFIGNNTACVEYNNVNRFITCFSPLEIDFDSIPAYVKDRLYESAENDLKTFDEREKSRLLIDLPMVGDYVKRKTGEIDSIFSIRENGLIDTSDSIYLFLCGDYCTHNTGTNNLKEPIKLDSLKHNGELKLCKAWIFSQSSSGGSRGCDKTIFVKVWEEN